MLKYLHFGWIIVLLASCSPASYIRKSANRELLKQDMLASAHAGICILDAGSGKYLYTYQADKYFVPASNAKIFSLYAGLKYLGDSLEGMRYTETADSLIIYPTGDPTLLHPDFKRQPVIEKLKKTHQVIAIDTTQWKTTPYGSGWGWDDYNSDYMAERSLLPVYGNCIKWIQSSQNTTDGEQTYVISEPDVNWPVRFNGDAFIKRFDVVRKKDENFFNITEGSEKYKEIQIPFITDGVQSAILLLKDTVGRQLVTTASHPGGKTIKTMHSQPADSLFRPMMYNSDNFFAEQTLLMVANKLTGTMNNEKIIDSLLATDLKGLPQQPRWVDGSGLSRYNLFTPEDFVWILQKMKNEFGLERLKHIFATGGQGTLKNYYLKDSGYIFAKTGTLTGQLAVSGFMTTKKNKLIFFSVLINNHRSSTALLRKGTETFLTGIRDRF